MCEQRLAHLDLGVSSRPRNHARSSAAPRIEGAVPWAHGWGNGLVCEDAEYSHQINRKNPIETREDEFSRRLVRIAPHLEMRADCMTKNVFCSVRLDICAALATARGTGKKAAPCGDFVLPRADEPQFARIAGTEKPPEGN
jgi:hypothetical protein